MSVGSIAVGVWVAWLVFAILIVQALIEGRVRVASIAASLMLAVWLLVGRFNPYLVTPCVAVIDIGLVFIVLGRDLRLN